MNAAFVEKKKTAKSGSQYEALEKSKTENGAKMFLNSASLPRYPFLQSEMIANDWLLKRR